MASSPWALLPPVIGSIVGGIIGASTTYWLNLRPSQIKDKEARVLEACGHLDEKIKDVLQYLQDCDIDISELRSQYLMTAAPGLQGTELDLVLYVEYEKRLHEIYSKARNLIGAFQTQPDEVEAIEEVIQATVTEDPQVHNDRTGGVLHPETQSEPDLRDNSSKPTVSLTTIELDMTSIASIIDDRLPLELLEAVSMSVPPESISIPEESGETAGRQFPPVTPSSTPADEDIGEGSDDLQLCNHNPPSAGLDILWPQVPTEGLVEAVPLEAAPEPRASVSTWFDMLEETTDGVRVACGSPQSSESGSEQTQNCCCCFCGNEVPTEAKHWESRGIGGWPSKALCDSCTTSARKAFRITYNKIL